MRRSGSASSCCCASRGPGAGRPSRGADLRRPGGSCPNSMLVVRARKIRYWLGLPCLPVGESIRLSPHPDRRPRQELVPPAGTTASWRPSARSTARERGRSPPPSVSRSTRPIPCGWTSSARSAAAKPWRRSPAALRELMVALQLAVVLPESFSAGRAAQLRHLDRGIPGETCRPRQGRPCAGYRDG